MVQREVIKQALAAGASFGGAELIADALHRTIEEYTDDLPEQILVRRAKVCGLNWKNPPGNKRIEFRDCEFVDELAVGWLEPHPPLWFDACRFAIEAHIDFSTDGTFLQNSILNDGLCFLEHRNANGAKEIHFVNIRVAGSASVRLRRSKRIRFAQCTFDSALEIQFDTDHCSEIDLQGCHVHGRVTIDCPTARPVSVEEVCVFLSGSAITGVLDLRRFTNVVLDTTDATFIADSLIVAERVRIRINSERKKDWSLRRAFKSVFVNGKEGTQLINEFSSLSRQYLALVGSFENVTLTNDPDSACAHRGGMYRLIADMHAEGATSLVCGWVLILLWVTVTFLTAIGFLGTWATGLIVAMPLAAAIGVVAFPESALGRNVRLQWNCVAIWGVLGFGVRALHPLISGAFLILFFTAVYYVGTNHFSVSGYISDADTGEASVIAPEDAAYFSVVTFTTLGYGDFKPYHSMRLIASIEAGIGALMLALLTAVFVRRFLKL